MMERVDDGDLSLEQCSKSVHGPGDPGAPRVRHALGACTERRDRSLPTTESPWNHAENLEDV